MTQVLVSGLLIGGIYALIALGINLIFGVMGIVNFAHGSLLMVGMYISFWLWTVNKMDPYVSLVFIALALFGLGWLIQSIAIKPLLKTRVGAEELPSMLLTAGFMMFLNNMVLLTFGPVYQAIHPSYKDRLIEFIGLRISYVRTINFIAALGLSFVIFIIIRKTYLGKKMRATAQDRETASLMGINTDHIYNIVTASGFALAGIAGGLLIPISYTYPLVGDLYTMKAFIIIVLGGLGNLAGALVGGLLLGIGETVLTQYVGTALAQIFFLIIFVIVIVIKPSGLFGKA
jgi:branched-chain amino acid transport system permease protein